MGFLNRMILRFYAKIKSRDYQDKADYYIGKLHHTNLDWRIVAIRNLGTIGDKTAVKSLKNFLKVNQNFYERSLAVSALAKIKDPDAINSMLLCLKGGSGYAYQYESLKLSVIFGLAKIGEPAKGILTKCLKDSDQNISAVAAEALERMGWKPSSDEEEAYFLVAKKKWKKIVKLGPCSISALINAMNSSDSFQKKEIAKILTKFGWEPSDDIEKLEFYLALGKWDKVLKHSKQLIDHLIKALNDEDSDFKKNVIKILGSIKDLKATEPLILMLADDSWGVSEAAEEALSAIGEHSVRPLLNALGYVDWRNWKVQGAIKNTLVKIGESAVNDVIMALERYNEEHLRVMLIQVLGEIGDIDAIEPLKKLAENKYDHYVSDAAKKAINEIVLFQTKQERKRTEIDKDK